MTEPLRLVIVESPYAGDIEANVAYARRCLRDSLARGEAPIASHLLYTQEGVLRDDVPDRVADVNQELSGDDYGQPLVTEFSVNDTRESVDLDPLDPED